MHKGIIGLWLCLMLAVTAWAGPLNPRDVSSSARWVIHLDAQAFWASQFGTQLMRIVDSNDIQAKLDALKIVSGSDLSSDLHSVTLYGPDSDETHVVALVKGQMDRQKLVSLSVLAHGYKKTTAGDAVIHQWQDSNDQKTQYMAFASDHELVVSQSRSTVEATLDVLAGKAQSIWGTERFRALKRVSDKPFVVACAEELADLTQDKANAAMLQKSSMLAFMAGEKAGFFNTTLQVETESSDVAVQIETMGRGILAMMQFQENKFPQVGPLIQACTLSSDDKTVELAFRYPLDKLMPIIKANVDKIKDRLE